MATDKRIYTGKNLSVVHRELDLPNGVQVCADVVKHPGAVAIVAFVSRSRVLLTRHARPALQEWLLEIPAGTLQPGEDPSSCARRELIEETGYAASSISKVTQMLPVPDYSDDLIHLYVAEDLTYVHQRLEKDEVIEVCTVDLGYALELIEIGAITDAKTIAALLLIQHLGARPRPSSFYVPFTESEDAGEERAVAATA